MKYFIFTHQNFKIYIAEFSEENIIRQLEDSIFKRLQDQDSIRFFNHDLKIQNLVRYLRRHPGQRLKVLGAKVLEGSERQLEYAVLNRESFTLSEDDSLSSELFYPQEELYKSLLTKNLDEILVPEAWQSEVKLDREDFVVQVAKLIGNRLLNPAYKFNAPTLSEQENPWTENLSSLAREVITPEGLVNGRNPENILIAFKRIA